ncbi:(2Fe-2S)-binding protein [Streptomyces sp. BE20]|uniref:(2Fe-2S)-binding protein n=1 Tax=Streptomyces sp. BE20 TaxID=3002525 RepID=UPI002E75EDD0|nr:(2Fe-2S)-binding protein [Streptomyces sp. BE20]MEE1825753.1 (2Fe-2S)-binding protein [Streptomyces sp. BE20]
MTVSSTRPGPAPRASAAVEAALALPPSRPVTTAPGPAGCTDPGADSTAVLGTTVLGTAAPGSTAPGAAAYQRLGGLLPALRVHCAPPRTGRGWIAGADLLTHPEALRELIAHDARQGLARYGRPLRPDVAAGFGLHRFVWPVSLLFTLPWFLERRVPLLAPADISIRRRTGELTVRPGAFVCLPDDPAAAPGGATARPEAPDAPGTAAETPCAVRRHIARTVPDEAALAGELRTALADFLTPLLAAFRPEVRRGPRTLWAMATDAAVESLWHAAGLFGEEERARAELSALLAPGLQDARPAPECAPFTPGAGFTGPASGSAVHSDRCRASCCLVYTVEAEAMCAGCPRVTRG